MSGLCAGNPIDNARAAKDVLATWLSSFPWFVSADLSHTRDGTPAVLVHVSAMTDEIQRIPSLVCGTVPVMVKQDVIAAQPRVSGDFGAEAERSGIPKPVLAIAAIFGASFLWGFVSDAMRRRKRA